MPVSSATMSRTDGGRTRTAHRAGAEQKAALAVRRCRHPIPIFSRDAMQYECSEARGGRRERKGGLYTTRETPLARSRRKVSNTIRQCHFHIEAKRAMVKCSLGPCHPPSKAKASAEELVHFKALHPLGYPTYVAMSKSGGVTIPRSSLF